MPYSTAADLFAYLWDTLEQQSREFGSVISLSAQYDEYKNNIHEIVFSMLKGEEVEGVIRIKKWLDNEEDIYTIKIGKLPNEYRNKLRIVFTAQAIDQWHKDALEAMTTITASERGQTLADRLVLDGSFNRDPERGYVILRTPLWSRKSGSEHLTLSAAEFPGYLFEILTKLPASIMATHPDENIPNRKVALSYKLGHPSDFPTPREGSSAGAPPTEASSTKALLWHVGFAPFAEKRDDIEMRVLKHDGLHWYDSCPVSDPARADAVVKKLCDEGAHIIVLPEMVADSVTLTAFKDALRKYGHGSKVLFAVVGTCVHSDGAVMPVNAAVVMDRHGKEIFKCAKLHRWNMTAGDCRRYEIDPPPEGHEMRFEFIAPGSAVTIFEMPYVGRFVVLICEDLARSEPGKWLRNNLFLDWQISPVMSGSIDEQSWTVNRGAKAAETGRCRVVVSNSLPLTHRQNASNSKIPHCAHSPVTKCGVGVCMDMKGEEKRHFIAMVPMDEQSPKIAVVAWDPANWPILPLTRDRA